MATEDKGASGQVSSSVQSLIDRLKEDGIAEGRSQAESIVAQAEANANKILAKAEAEAEKIKAAAAKEAQSLETATKDALKVANRDAVLSLKANITRQFAEDLKRLVGEAMADEEFLKQMILEVVRRGAEDAGAGPDETVEFVLPRDVVGLEELRKDPQKLKEGSLTKYVLQLTGDLLRQRAEINTAEGLRRGMRVVYKDSEVVLDLTDEAVANLILEHLQPRFRALLEGIVK